MRERHPIDEFFGALSDAEATPPPAVWHGVVQRRHWGHRLLLQLERKWGWAMLLLLLLGGPIVWLAAQGGAVGEVVRAETAAPIVHAELGAGLPPVALAVPMEEMNVSALDASARAPADLIIEASAMEKPLGSHAMIEAPGRTIAGGGEGEPAEGTADMTVPSRSGDVTSDPGIAVDQPLNTAPMPASIDEQREAAFKLELMAPRPIGVHSGVRPLPLGLDLIKKVGEVAFVLANGNWFIGIQGGIVRVTGSWKGPGELVKKLNENEEWRGQRSISLLAGYRWNNGWSLATGVGMAYRDSRFLYRGTGPGSVIELVDTSWLVTPAGSQNYSTWNIDTLHMTEPGVEQDLSASNHYELLRIPVEISKQWSRARWTLDLRGGAVLGTTLQREGRTLAVTETIPGDSTTAPIDVVGDVVLRDDRFSDRFGFSIALFAGADLGYRLGDRLSVHFGPQYAKDVLGGHEVRSRTSQLGAVLRIEHNFSVGERRSPALPR